MRARGLKLILMVASAVALASRPMRARGLKHAMQGYVLGVFLSRPAWARGLKLVLALIPLVDDVAPRVGAWIAPPF